MGAMPFTPKVMRRTLRQSCKRIEVILILRTQKINIANNNY